MLNKPYFVTGIGTGVGKTVISTILASALDADYWKPVQAGDLNQSDSMTVNSLACRNHGSNWPETFALKYAIAPQKAAEIEGISMELNDFSLPETNNNLVIEGAGGCAVPLNDHVTYGHLIKKWDCKTFLVVKNYLGSINHTLLSLAYMKSLNIDIAGIIISGATNPNSERSYEIHGQVPIVARVPWANKLTRSFVQEQSELLKEKLERFIEV